VSGPNVMAGYCERADATGDAFRKGLYDPIVEACLPLTLVNGHWITRCG
jgi:hypothetical protein